MQRVVLVGCGFMGRMHDSVYRLLPSAEVVAYVDHKPERGAKLAGNQPLFGTIAEALSSVQCDVVDVCLPTFLHASATIQAAKSGKHIFCEKPMALTEADAAQMIAAAQGAGVTLMIGHCIRFWPEYEVLTSLIQSRRFGRLLSLNLTRFGEFPSWSSDNWLADESKAGGGALDMHIHDTDYALYALGQPEQITSWGTRDGRGTSHIFTTMKYPDGAIVHLEGGWNLPPKTPFKMAFRAIFESGAAIMDGGPLTIYPASGEPEQPEMPQMQAEGGGNISDLGGYFYELKYFVECLEQGKAVERCTPESALRSLSVCLGEIAQVPAL